MVIKIWTVKQLNKLEETAGSRIPSVIMKRIIENLTILDDAYGSNRDVDNDNGGYILLIIDESEERRRRLYENELEKLRIKEDEMEFEDNFKIEKQQWKIDTYITGNDYGVLIVYTI